MPRSIAICVVIGGCAMLTGPAAGFRFVGSRLTRAPRLKKSQLEAVAIYFGTEGGATGDIAGLINDALPETGENVFLIDDLEDPSELLNYDSLIVGCPTWNTGADTERSGTPWDDLYYEDDGLPSISLKGKKVAVFGCGDSVSYGENFCDAAGELHDVMQQRGATMFGASVNAGDGSDYMHSASKSLRGDHFCGLLCDQVNQPDLSPGRVTEWVAQLKAEGFLSPSGAPAPADGENIAVEHAAPAAPEPAPASIPEGVSAAEPAAAASELATPSSLKGSLWADEEASLGSFVDDYRKLIVSEREATAAAVARARAEVEENYSPRILELERAIAVASALPLVELAAPPAAAAAEPAPAEAPPAVQRIFAIPDKLKGAVSAEIRSNTVLVPDGPGSNAIAHITAAFTGDDRLPFVEGQCVSILPPGDDPKTGKPHKKKRIYTIASSRDGEGDGAGDIAICVRLVPDGVATTWLHNAPVGTPLHLEGPAGKSMVLPEDLTNDLVLVATATGVATYRGFLRRLFVEADSPEAREFAAGGGRVLLVVGAMDAASIPYHDELAALAAAVGPARLRMELALGGGRVDAGGETTLPETLKSGPTADLVREYLDGGGELFVGGLKGMLKPVEAALGELGLATPLKELKKLKRYHSEVY
jgi:flavodoxin long chain